MPQNPTPTYVEVDANFSKGAEVDWFKSDDLASAVFGAPVTSHELVTEKDGDFGYLIVASDQEST